MTALPQSYSAELTDLENPTSVRTFSGVTSDGVISDETGKYLPFRFLSLSDQSRVEFPMGRYIIKFSPERALIAAAGQARRAQAQREQEDAPRPKIN